MKYELIVSGLDSQGVASLAQIIVHAANRSSLLALQADVQGLAHRKGAAVAHVRISDDPMYHATVSRGEADLVISLEALEGLRHAEYLRADGTLVTSTETVKNVPTYPATEAVLQTIRALPRAALVDAAWLASEVGDPASAPFVMLGAAAHLLPIPIEELTASIREAALQAESLSALIALEAFEAGRSSMRHEHLVDEYSLV